MSREETVERAMKALKDELESGETYLKLSKRFRDVEVSSKLKEIAGMERAHAEFWAEFLKNRGVDVSNIRASRLKIGAVLIISRILGLGLILKLLESSERAAINLYSEILDAPGIDAKEKEAVKKILEEELLHERELLEGEERFKGIIYHVREVVLGMSDGIVEVLSVSVGLAGAYGRPEPVVLGGLIVGVAGALSKLRV